MLRTTLAVAVVLMYSSVMLAQHSAGGGGSSSGGGGGHSSGGSSVGSSGGGSHSSSGGSSSGSSGGHSGGSASHNSASSSGHGASSHGGSAHGSSSNSSGSRELNSFTPRSSTRVSSTSERSEIRRPEAEALRNIHGFNVGTRSLEPEKSEKRSFWSALRHPFRKPEPRPVLDLRRRICFGGPCHPCPVGVGSKGGCSTGLVTHPASYFNPCSGWEMWRGSSCVANTHFLGDCSGLRMAYERQLQRLQAGDTELRQACAAGVSLQCDELSAKWQSQSSLVRALQQRYLQCQQRSVAYPYAGFTFGSYLAGPRFDPLGKADDIR